MEAPEWLSRLIERADETENLWWVLAAIRGPDDKRQQCDLKGYTTERIRGILSEGLKGYDDICSGLIRFSPLDDDEIVRRDEMLAEASDHFRDHFFTAMRYLHEFDYAVPHEELPKDVNSYEDR